MAYTIQIKTSGNGTIKSSGGDNTLAVRNSITIPDGSSVYFEAVPATGEQFVKWVSADGVSSTANPLTLPVNSDGTITGYFTGSSSNNNIILYIVVAVILVMVYFALRK